jgi:glycosyltransferase involved in cell wall biosynthesis
MVPERALCYGGLRMLISLIMATLGRTEELREYFESLDAQTYRSFEVIVIDQNEDDRLEPIIAPFRDRFPIVYIKSPIRLLSHARNQGLPHIKGDIVGFPDDDCVYSKEILQQVHDHFAANPRLGLVSGPAISPEGGFGSGRWTLTSGPLTLENVWTTISSFTFFMRREAVDAIGPYDEGLGIGAKYGSGEETDYAIRILRAGYLGYYDTSFRVTHPDKTLTAVAADRAYLYGLGMGRVLRKHSMAAHIALPYYIRPLGGMLLSLLRGNLMNARYYWGTWKGRVAGYLAPPAAY